MSSNRRGRVFTPRWGLATINPNHKRKFPEKDIVAYLNRVIKRMNKAAGHDTAKQPCRWQYEIDGNLGTVEAFTRSEARAEIKKAIGRKGRLPKSLKLEKVHDPNERRHTPDSIVNQSDCSFEGDTESRPPCPEIVP